jgi:pyruvate/2-oxoglutarate dehydrogenase complex dihydrolipoamide dehydrogenase (E3) component
VTVVEVLPQILPVEDEEIAAHARKRFEKQGIKIITGAKVTKVQKKADSVVAEIEDGKGAKQSIEAERVISAAGVVGNIENLGLEALGVKTERGTIVVDGYGKTNVPGIYAIGDVAGAPMLAHKASHEGIVCIEAIKGLKPHAMDKSRIAGCTYCFPQIASVGLTEKEGEGAGTRGTRRPLPLPRQRQGDRAGRAGRARQDDLRQEDRRVTRRASGRRGSDGTDPGLRHRDESGDHGGRTDGNRVPASDALGNDA